MQQVDADLLLIANAKNEIRQFRFLYEKYHGAIFQYIHKRTHDMALTADITADTFLIAMQQLAKYEYRGLPFSAWLYRIAANELNIFYRKNQKHPFISFTPETYQEFSKDFETDENKEPTEKKLVKAISKLSTDEQELIAFAYTDLLPYTDIAAIKATTEDNIKVKMFRIRQKLKKLIDTLNDE